MKIRVLSRAEVEAGNANGADAVISIRGSGDGLEPELGVALAQATGGESARLLRLVFDDIGMASYGHFVGPTIEQVAAAIEFGRRVVRGRDFFEGASASAPVVAVHCEHGKSRSAAIALALLADQFGVGAEVAAVNALLRSDVETRMHPNPLVVSLADACLFRYGRIDAALVAASPAYVKWRGLWQNIIADPDAYWDKARRVLGKRDADNA